MESKFRMNLQNQIMNNGELCKDEQKEQNE